MTNASATVKLRRSARILWFVVLLLPLSLTFDGTGVSANYLFALLLLSPRGFRRNNEILLYCAFMVLAFVWGVLFFSGLDPSFLFRQVTSFLLAMIAIVVVLVRLAVTMEEFLTAVVFAAAAYSAYAILMTLTHGFSLSDIYAIKGLLRPYVADWPQRYVVVLLLGLFVAISRFLEGIRWQLAFGLILTTIFLTFTRAAWIATGLGAFAYVLARPRRVRPTLRRTGRVTYGIAGAVILGGLMWQVSDGLIRAAIGQVIENTIGALTFEEATPGSSEGLRTALFFSLIDVVFRSPIVGTGFAGAYLVIPDSGSAHGQYLDVLLRTGIVGLLLYLRFWQRLFAHYVRVHRGVFAGLIAIFSFGVFHETTKLTYGAVIFAVLLNKMYEARSIERRRRRAAAEFEQCVASSALRLKRP